MSARAELSALEASGLLQVATLEPELEYLFRHALVQDAAYASLLRQDRRALHRVAADTILSLYPERRGELAGVIALHLERAGDTAAAAEHLVIAGEHAAERFASREAVAFFDRAEAHLGENDPRVELRLRAALGAAKSGWTRIGPTAAIERLERAIASADDRTDRKLLADAYFWCAFLRRARGERLDSSPELKRAVERTVEIGAAIGDPLAQAIPNAFMAVGMLYTGHVRDGARMLEEALRTIEASADPISVAILGDVLTVAYARLGEFAAAERAIARSERAAAAGDPIARLDEMIARSAIMIERGDIAEGEALASQCAVQSEELGALACSVGSNVLAGAAHLARDDALGARAPLERGRELAQFSSMAPMRTLADGLLASVRARLGDLPAGIVGWNDALERARSTNDLYGEATTLWQRARAFAQRTPPDLAGALADLDAAAPLYEAMETRPALARVLRERARILHALGRDAEADDADMRSRSIVKELGLRDLADVAQDAERSTC